MLLEARMQSCKSFVYYKDLILVTVTLLIMGLFDFLKKPVASTQATLVLTDTPYKEQSTNVVYNLLFCDDLYLYKASTTAPYTFPFDVLFSEQSTNTDLQRLIDDANADPRVRALAYNKQRASGYQPTTKELLAVIVEVGLDNGLDVLAAFNNGTARYINQTGKILVWETTTDAKANALTKDLFSKSQQIVDQIGPWNGPRKRHPSKGNTRISFLVSDGLYFGEAPTDVLFSDPLASPALASATQLMQYLTEKALAQSSGH